MSNMPVGGGNSETWSHPIYTIVIISSDSLPVIITISAHVSAMPFVHRISLKSNGTDFVESLPDSRLPLMPKGINLVYLIETLIALSKESYSPEVHYRREKNPRYPLDRRLGGPQNRSGH
jgi:hypothetical protein